jgi:hypothetical protein
MTLPKAARSGMVLEKASRKSDAELAAERKANTQPGGVTSIRNALVARPQESRAVFAGVEKNRLSPMRAKGCQ